MIKAILNFIKSLFVKEVGNGKGLLPDPIDHRDVLLESIFKKDVVIPEEYNVPFKMRITNQGSKPHCVGYAVATIKEFLEQKEQNNIEFDGSWIYREAKKIDGIPNFRGTYFRAGLKVLKNTGAMPLKGGDPSLFRIGGYARVTPTLNSLKEAIYRYGAVLIGFPVISNEGWATANIRKPRKGEKTYGHALSVAVGYTKYKIKFQNSWGKKWGDKGYGYFTKDSLPSLAWAILIDLPNNWKELLARGNKPKYFFEKNLSIGIKSEGVKILQDCLKFLGCFDPKIDSTGYFGPITKEALIVFQQRYSITPAVGFFGPITRAKMNELFA